jgi:hypothetical protein
MQLCKVVQAFKSDRPPDKERCIEPVIQKQI